MSSLRTEAPRPIRELYAPTADEFRTQILPSGEPAVVRAIAMQWPLVIAARQSAGAAMALLAANAGGTLTDVLRADPAEDGRFHYGSDRQSMNFIRGRGNLPGLFAGLSEQERAERPFSIAAQAMVADDFVPGFTNAHPMPFAPASAKARLWIGNASKVATHNDPFDNVAVVAAGRRRFTLFPPDAEPDLYMGPRDPSPAGTPVSMVHVTAPDLDRYPLFTSALAVAQEAELSAGDAIFIPRDWFHHVEALERFNVLVNYWWNADESGVLGGVRGEIDE